MPHSSFTDPTTDLGRQLTTDVATLALSLPVIARNAFSVVVLPFVFSASLALIVLFLTPLRDVPFVAQHATHGLSALRLGVAGYAIVNLLLPGYAGVDYLSLRWTITLVAAVLGVVVLSIDLRRVFSS